MLEWKKRYKQEAAKAEEAKSSNEKSITNVKNIEKSKEFEQATKMFKPNDYVDLKKKQDTTLPEQKFWSGDFESKSKKDLTKVKTSKIPKCPITSKDLKISDLFAVKFAEKSIRNEKKFICPITSEVLTDSMQLVYLKESNYIISKKSFDEVVKESMIDPINNAKLKKDDIIFVARVII